MLWPWKTKSLKKILFSEILRRDSLSTAYTLIEACLIGILSALAALLLKEGIGWLGGYRVQASITYGSIVVLPVMGLICGLIVGFLIEYVAPEAKGGGIPQVKAALSGFQVTINLKTAIVKIISTILIIGSSFVIGRRAPTVQIGASLAAQLSDWLPTTPERRRQMIAAGAAAGLAAGFNTPIAGVLFVIEELMRDASNLTLETAILASFVGSAVSRYIREPVLLNISEEISVNLPNEFTSLEIIFYIILGLLAGILGGIFNRSLYFSFWVNNKIKLSLPLRIGLAGMISGIIIAFLPDLFLDRTELRNFLIISDGDFGFTSLAFVAYFFLTIIAASSGASGGLFAPALILGACLGDLVALAKFHFFGTGLEYIYTLAGMGAFFTAVVRVPVTATVIVFEMTGEYEAVLPLMVACCVAYFVAETISKGSVYEKLLENMGIPLKEQSNSAYFLKGLTAASIMQKNVEVLNSNLNLAEVIKIISVSKHNGFPVIEGEKLVGIFTKGDWRRLGDTPLDTPIKKLMTPRPISVTPETDLGNVLYLLDKYQFSRLPVIARNQLMGIITRTDIINAEAKWISGKGPIVSKQSTIDTIYQTRSHRRGKGRILLPLANPERAPSLFKIAVAIASYYEYEIECMEVIPIPKHTSVSEANLDLQQTRSLMQRVETWGLKYDIPIHTRVCVAQDIAEAILEVITESNVNLTLVGWQGNLSNSYSIFSTLTDKLITQAPSDLMIVKLGTLVYPDQLYLHNKWLIPVSGGPNVARGIELLPSLLSIYPTGFLPSIVLTQIFEDPDQNHKFSFLEKVQDSIQAQLQVRVKATSYVSQNVATAIIDVAKHHNIEVVMLGASREGLLKQAINGNIAKTVARGVDSTVILVRSANEFR